MAYDRNEDKASAKDFVRGIVSGDDSAELVALLAVVASVIRTLGRD